MSCVVREVRLLPPGTDACLRISRRRDFPICIGCGQFGQKPFVVADRESYVRTYLSVDACVRGYVNHVIYVCTTKHYLPLYASPPVITYVLLYAIYTRIVCMSYYTAFLWSSPRSRP